MEVSGEACAGFLRIRANASLNFKDAPFMSEEVLVTIELMPGAFSALSFKFDDIFVDS